MVDGTGWRFRIARGASMNADTILSILPDRFVAKIVVDPVTGCWNWTAGATPTGRGRYTVDGKKVYPYRLTLAIRLGVELSELAGILGRHQCDNPACCNPFHVEPGSHKDNFEDMVDRGRGRGSVMERVYAARQRAANDRELRRLDARFADHMAAD